MDEPPRGGGVRVGVLGALEPCFGLVACLSSAGWLKPLVPEG